MGFFVVMPLILLSGGPLDDGEQRAAVIAAWGERYQRIQTAEYVLEGTELITPAFLTGLADAPDSFVVRQRPLKILLRIDFPNKKLYVRREEYEWQVHLERFRKKISEIVVDQKNDLAMRCRQYAGGKVKQAKKVKVDSEVAKVLGRVDLLPLWLNSGIAPVLSRSSAFDLPDYGNDAGTRWCFSRIAKSMEHGGSVRATLRYSDNPRCDGFVLDTGKCYLPTRITITSGDGPQIEIRVSSHVSDGVPIASKWEVADFSSLGQIEKCVSLSVKSAEMNVSFPPDAFRLTLTGD